MSTFNIVVERFRMLIRANDEPARLVAAEALKHLVTAPRNAGEWYVDGVILQKLVVLCEIAEFSRKGDVSLNQASYASAFANLGGSRVLREAAAECYREALKEGSNLAEAHYNLACLLRDMGNTESAARHFELGANLPPHLGGKSHAHLAANAHWERARILDATGRYDEAVSEYREALHRLDNFGIAHRQYPDLLRRLGNIDEALEHYDRLIRYSHRYPPEFVGPDFTVASTATDSGCKDGAVAPSSLDPSAIEVYEEYNKYSILRANGCWYLVPSILVPITAEDLKDTRSRQGGNRTLKAAVDILLSFGGRFLWRFAPGLVRWRLRTMVLCASDLESLKKMAASGMVDKQSAPAGIKDGDR